jgi:hypothetical protein
MYIARAAGLVRPKTLSRAAQPPNVKKLKNKNAAKKTKTRLLVQLASFVPLSLAAQPPKTLRS